MKIAKLLAAAAAMSMVAAPVMATPTGSAAKLSLSKNVRAGKTTAAAEQARGGSLLIPAIAAIAVILLIILVADDDGAPRSP
jgi:hypothetical protein